MDDDMLTLGEAAEAFAIPRIKLWRWVKGGKLVAFQSERDLREKLVRRGDVEALLRPRPIRDVARDSAEGKVAA